MTTTTATTTTSGDAGSVPSSTPLQLPRAAPLPAAQLALIKATVPILQQHGEAITREMYSTLIAAHPSLRDIFSHTSQTNGRQPRALANAVLAYAMYIDDLPKLTQAVERIAQKHVSLFVRAEQYDVVGDFLLRAIRTVLGGGSGSGSGEEGVIREEKQMEEVLSAWGAAYGILKGVFVTREEALYAADGEAWRHGWRPMRIARKVVEAEGIVSFWLASCAASAEREGEEEKKKKKPLPLPRFLPGQYVTVQVDVPQLGHKQCRQFSLSNAPGEEGEGGATYYYRVSVKREKSTEAGGGHGLVSNLLHDHYDEGDTVGVSHPHGQFFLDPSDRAKEEGSPVVFISAGVGATPLVSMLKAFALASEGARRPISWIHTSRSKGTQPFAQEVSQAVETLRRRGEVVRTHVHLTAETKGTGGSRRLDIARLLTTEELADGGDALLFVKDARTEYFVCGPEEFMMQVRKTLVDSGVGRERVHLELFATGDVEED